MFENKENPLSRNKFVNNMRKLKEKSNGTTGVGKGLRATKSPINLTEKRPSKLQQQLMRSKQNNKSGIGKNLFATQEDNEKLSAFASRLLPKLILTPETTNSDEMQVDSNSGNRFTKLKPKLRFEEDCLFHGGDDRCKSPEKTKKLFSEEAIIPATPISKQYDEGYDLVSLNFGNFGTSFHSRREQLDGASSRFEADFIKCEILGSGNFGTVYKCMNKIDGMEYAVKTIRHKRMRKSILLWVCANRS